MSPSRHELIARIQSTIETPVQSTIEKRLLEFKKFRTATNHDIFKELCFCILTANCSAEMCLKVHEAIGDRFLTTDSSMEFTRMLKENKYRFYNVRGSYLEESCQYRDNIKEILDEHEDELNLREWLVKNVKGLGYKEASHFLRNVGYENLAIIDFHVIDILCDHALIKKPKTLTKRRYLQVEDVLRGISEELEISLAALDLYLWYFETGKILK
ncbi:N-glycosylase/DNA lyase [Candidatus Bathyarchaeota archaeon]|nr:N-glycosylase/DNA lyase [Candidatus Bathyarchaeota archaeon]